MGMLAVLGAARAPKVLKASVVIRELPNELHERERGVRRGLSSWIVAVRRRHTVKILDR
jgi:hypothetical protein